MVGGAQREGAPVREGVFDAGRYYVGVPVCWAQVRLTKAKSTNAVSRPCTMEVVCG